MRFDIAEIQEQLRYQALDGWLLYLLRGQNPTAVEILGLPRDVLRTRRCFYWIPREGAPVKLLHRIEPASLDGLPGEERFYLSYRSLESSLDELLRGSAEIAMEYSPRCAIPTVSLVDGGTLELVRDCGVRIASSADLVQAFQARLTRDQVISHLEAAAVCRDTAREVFHEVERRLRAGETVRETEIRRFILDRFASAGLRTAHPPIVAGGAHSGNPHYAPGGPEDLITPGQVLLVDLWAKCETEGAVYADQTWMGYTGREAPPPIQRAWQLVRDARRASWRLISERYAAGDPVCGWEADDCARGIIEGAGLGEHFIHRTGHSIGEEDHGGGANLDNLETRELRRLIPGTLFSIEPGLYFDDFGVRSEFNVLISLEGEVLVAEGTDQQDLFLWEAS